ncbi:MAG: hypothetical protein E7013_01835 [Alphaproteobacteria bacterium]|nr:hypothetical protein [Alphaproteobacteria bacterium]
MKKIALLVLCLIAFTSVAKAAENRTLLGTYGDWSAYKMKENGANLCYMASVPQKSAGKYKRRGEIFLIVAHRPKEKSFNVVSLTAGYNYKKGSVATIQIDKKEKIELFTHEDTAWAPKTDIDNQLYRMMKAGNKAVIVGKSSLGNTTTDTFSLKGFTKAANAIDKACGKK